MLALVFSCAKDDTIVSQEKEEVSENENLVTEVDEPIVENPIEETPEDVVEVVERITGASFCGPYTVSEPISLTGLKDTIVSGLDISNPNGVAIMVNSCENLIIENSFLHDSSGNGIQIYGSTNVTIRNNRMESISTGVYALQSTGIKVINNDIKNVEGPFPRGQFVQFNGCSGANNKINNNAFQNIEGQSYGEDAVNLFDCHGTAGSPIEIKGNWIKNFTPSLTGGGIMTGDRGGSYIRVAENILVDNGPFGYGIGIASGHDIIIENNTLVGRNKLYQYVPIFMNNIYVENQPCFANTIRNNRMSWIETRDRYTPIGYFPDVCGEPIGIDTNDMLADIDGTVLAENIFIDCQAGTDGSSN